MTLLDGTGDGYFSVLRLHREDLIDRYPGAAELDDSDMEDIAESMSDTLMEQWGNAMSLALQKHGYEVTEIECEDDDIYAEDEFDLEEETDV